MPRETLADFEPLEGTPKRLNTTADLRDRGRILSSFRLENPCRRLS